MFQFQTGPSAFNIIVDEPRFDASNAKIFRHQFMENCPDRIQAVDIDFTRVELIDSSGIGALLSIRKRIQPPTPVALRNSCPAVLSIIQTMRLHRVFELDDGLPDPLADTPYYPDQLPG